MTDAIKKILLVDDEERLLNSMAQRLSLLGFEALRAASGAQAVEIAGTTDIDLAIVDLKLPDMDGLTTITKLKEIDPDLKTVLLTGYGSRQTRKTTRTLGSEYFEKDSMGALWDLIKQMNTQDSLVVVNQTEPSEKSNGPSGQGAPPARPSHKPQTQENISLDRRIVDLPKLIGETPKMQRVRKDIKRLSELDCPISIRGETGTGKELAARAIHRLSYRSNQRFLAFNCGCFSDDFHFDELLGSLGSGTAYQNNSPVPVPFSGTILLDHFEAMPAQTQEQMIHILDQKPGAASMNKKKQTKDIRFIIAMHQDLKKRVDQGKFNPQLYRRLNAIDLAIPPLRERQEDIYPLASYFLNTLNTEFQKNIESISDEVFSLFMSYPFPGNVRELKHLIERAVILADGSTITPAHLPERFTKKSGTQNQTESESQSQSLPTLGELEQNHILKALKTVKGNKSKTAEILGISRAALWRKLKLINAKEL